MKLLVEFHKNKKTNVLFFLQLSLFKKYTVCTLAGVARWIECWSANQKVAGLIPSRGTCYRPGPRLGM